MWSFITNPIVTHLITAALGAGGAWYATHKTAAAAAGAAVKSAADAVASAVKDVSGKA